MPADDPAAASSAGESTDQQQQPPLPQPPQPLPQQQQQHDPAAVSAPGPIPPNKVLAPSDAMHRVRELIVKGFLDVGQVLHFTYREASFQGTVGEQGDILYINAAANRQESFRAPSAFANSMAKRHNSANRVRVRGRINLNGWDWCSTDTGETLQQLRNMMVTGEEAPVKRKRSLSPEGGDHSTRKIPRFDSATDPNIDVCDDDPPNDKDQNPDLDNVDSPPMDEEEEEDEDEGGGGGGSGGSGGSGGGDGGSGSAEGDEGSGSAGGVGSRSNAGVDDAGDEIDEIDEVDEIDEIGIHEKASDDLAAAAARPKRSPASSGDASGGNLADDENIALALAAAEDGIRRRTTRLASGSIKQIDYKQAHAQDQAALAKSKSGEDEEEDDQDQNPNTSNPGSVGPNDAATNEGRRTRANKRRGTTRRPIRYRRPGDPVQYSPEDNEVDPEDPEGATRDQIEEAPSPPNDDPDIPAKQDSKGSRPDEEFSKRDPPPSPTPIDSVVADAASNDGQRPPGEDWSIDERIALLDAIRTKRPKGDDVAQYPTTCTACEDVLKSIPGLTRKPDQIKAYLSLVENRIRDTQLCGPTSNFFEFTGFLASEIARAKEKGQDSDESDGTQKPPSPCGKASESDKGKKKQRKELEELRQKLDSVMQSRRDLDLEKSVLDVQVRDARRALEENLRVRMEVEEELETFKNRELEARRRLDRAKLKISALKGESVVGVVESVSLQGKDSNDSDEMDAEKATHTPGIEDNPEYKKIKKDQERQQAMITLMEYETADFQRSLQAERKRNLLLQAAKGRLEYELYVMNAGFTKRSGESGNRKNKLPASGGTSTSKTVPKRSGNSVPGPSAKRGPSAGGIHKTAKGTAKRKGQPVKSPS